MSPTGTGTSNRRWACETRAKYEFFKNKNSFVLCFPTRASAGTPTRDLQFDGEIAFCCTSDVLASLLGSFAPPCQRAWALGGFVDIHSGRCLICKVRYAKCAPHSQTARLAPPPSLRPLSPRPRKAAAPKGPAFCFLNY